MLQSGLVTKVLSFAYLIGSIENIGVMTEITGSTKNLPEGHPEFLSRRQAGEVGLRGVGE